MNLKFLYNDFIINWQLFPTTLIKISKLKNTLPYCTQHAFLFSLHVCFCQALMYKNFHPLGYLHIIQNALLSKQLVLLTMIFLSTKLNMCLVYILPTKLNMLAAMHDSQHNINTQADRNVCTKMHESKKYTNQTKSYTMYCNLR